MKKVQLTVREFFLFKQLAKFMYVYYYKKNSIFVEAETKQLELLGY